MIRRYYEYLLESSSGIDLKYLALDWDDNILHMPTFIHLDHLVDGEWVHEPVSTAKFATVRNDKVNWRYREDSFSEFRDFGPRGETAFLEDTISAINSGDLGPSWDAFIEYLSQGTIFAIITARGHEPNAIKMAVEYIIDNILTENQKHSLYAHCLKFAYLFGANLSYDSYDRIPRGQLSKTKLIKDYLNSCDYYGVSSNFCIEKFGLGDAGNPEKGKEMAIKEFTKQVNEFGQKIGAKSVSLGFSDDDIKNVKHIEKLFRDELSLKYLINYNIYDTSKREIKGGVRTKIDPQVVESTTSWGNGAGTWGTDSSVLPFTKWNNMTQNLYPNSKDFSNDDYHNQFKNQIGQLKDLTVGVDKKKT